MADGLRRLAQTILNHERTTYLATHPEDVGNGFAPPRVIHWRTTPLTIAVPRTRGGFYPESLTRYQRTLPDAHGQFLRDLLFHAKSFSELARTVRRLGLPFAPDEIEPLLEELYAEARDFMQRPLPSDYLCVMIDAKAVRIRDEKGTLLRGHTFLALGITLEGRKEILGHSSFHRPESLESWKTFLLDLKNRGLTRVGLFVTDAFPGLTKLLAGAGGLFHTHREATVKIYILADHLHRFRWHKPNAHLKAHLAEWIRLFHSQYESETPSPFLTQNS